MHASHDVETCMSWAHPNGIGVAMVRGCLTIVIVFLLADTEGCKCDHGIGCGGYVMDALASFGGEAEIIGDDRQHCGEVTQVGSLIVLKVSWWSGYHSNFWKPV